MKRPCPDSAIERMDTGLRVSFIMEPSEVRIQRAFTKYFSGIKSPSSNVREERESER